ncbi:MAG: acyl-CoA synthetase (AMP-forming)/AMP-acid ligase II [Gammaproteobacteria bacterium]
MSLDQAVRVVAPALSARRHNAALSALTVVQLRSFGARPAVIAGNHVITFDELAERVADRIADRFATDCPVKVIVARPDLETVVEFLAALDVGDPVALAPDVAAATQIEARFGDTKTDGIHPDLALLMSTSGSTGTSKLVRLSKTAVTSNALAIANYLELGSDDRAITSLPLHYCYGLSVLTSHLAVGASIVLTENAVVDPCFWAAIERWNVTGFAGVAYTFELLERQRATGVERLAASSLRYVTQAGGRLDPAAVDQLVRLGDHHGFDLFVMYGQTEATARMAYLDPSDARTWPNSIGRPIPGGSIELRPVPDAEPGVGEIVYTGPNVMMGYANSGDDLARGHEFNELPTGDLARWNNAGLLEIVGRANRIVKVHGLRTDLDQLEADLAQHGVNARCTGDDSGLVIARIDETAKMVSLDPELLDVAAQLVAIPAGRLAAVSLPTWPRTPSGKVDLPAVTTAARSIPRADTATGTVQAVFELIVGQVSAPSAQTFASLGGDSFSYVEMSIRLEALIGTLPTDWHLQSVMTLTALADEHKPNALRRWARLDTSLVIRAVAIVLIVCTHMGLYRLPGGAHTLLMVLGYNVARFQLSSTDTPRRLRKVSATVARVAVPTVAWIGTQMLLFGGYSVGALFLVNNYFGSAWRRDGRWDYWYFETFVQATIVIGLLFAIPAVRRAERRAPFGFALAVVAVTLVFRFQIVELGDAYNSMFRPHTVACFIALGWAAQRARHLWQGLVVTGLLAATSIGYFGQVDREWRIILFGAALIWLPTIPVPRLAVKPIGVIAAASMHIFLIHWQVWPLFTPWLDPHVALAATIAIGVAAWWAINRLSSRVRQQRSTASHAGGQAAVLTDSP